MQLNAKGQESIHDVAKLEGRQKVCILNALYNMGHSNMKKAVAARREMATAENLSWSKDGVAHSTICGDISIDGAGATRSYGKGYKGVCAAANAIDRVTGLPLDVLTSQVGSTFSTRI